MWLLATRVALSVTKVTQGRSGRQQSRTVMARELAETRKCLRAKTSAYFTNSLIPIQDLAHSGEINK